MNKKLDKRKKIEIKSQKIFSGFSLVELLIVMVVVAVLVGLAAAGITTVQRNARNARRIEVLSEMKIGVENYFTRNGIYPDTRDVFEYDLESQWRVCYDTTSCTDHYEIDAPEEYLRPRRRRTTSESTAFCFIPGSNRQQDYALAVLLEANRRWWQASTEDWVQVGTSDTECSGFLLSIYALNP